MCCFFIAIDAKELCIFVFTISFIIESNLISNLTYDQACYSHPNSTYILAAGDLANEAKIFRTDTKKCVGVVSDSPEALYSISMNRNCDMIAMGGGTRELWVMSFDGKLTADFLA